MTEAPLVEANSPPASAAQSAPPAIRAQHLWHRYGSLDVLTANEYSGSVSVLLNRLRVTAVGPSARPRLFLHPPMLSGPGGPVVLAYSIEANAVPIRLGVYDVRGRVIWSSPRAIREPGEHRMLWQPMDRDGNRIARGVYLVRLDAGDANCSRKFVLLPP